MASAISLNPSNPISSNLSSGARLVSTDGKTLPLTGTEISADTRGGIARVVLEQTFVNPYDQPLQVSYLLPLPAEGAVSGFRFSVAGRTVIGEVDTKKQARERFEEAIASGRTAAILEQQRANQFKQEVGNIPPRSEVVCEIVVDQKLTWLGNGAWEWRFPTVVGPRYMGAPGRVKDAAELNVPVSAKELLTRCQLSLRVRDAIPAGKPSSSSHTLSSDKSGSETQVKFGDGGGVRLDRDIVVRWNVSTPDVGVSLDVACPSDERHGDDDAFALLTLVPPTPGSAVKPVPRDLIFLIDTSGSMGGEPLKQSKRILGAMIDSLGDKDQIEMIEFGSVPRRWKQKPAMATRDGKRGAMTWLKSLRASGATEMHRAVVEALTPLREDSQRQVVLVTDGYIGFENEIVREVIERLPKGARLHTIGVGSAPNRALTKPAAHAGGGVEVIVGVGEDPEPGAKRLLERTVSPYVTDVVVEGDGVEHKPARLPDLYAGSPALLSLRVSANGGTLTVRGTTADGDWEQTLESPTLAHGQGNPGITALYGREWIEDLEAERTCSDNLSEMDGSIERVALRFQIASRMTSWIAVDDEITVDPEDELIREVMPHELPYGTSIEGFGLRAGTTAFGAGGAPPAPAGRKLRKRLDSSRTMSGRGSSFKDAEAEETRLEVEAIEDVEDKLAFQANEDRPVGAMLDENFLGEDFDEAPGEDFDERIITSEMAVPTPSEPEAEDMLLREATPAKQVPPGVALGEARKPSARRSWWWIFALLAALVIAWWFLFAGVSADSPAPRGNDAARGNTESVPGSTRGSESN